MAYFVHLIYYGSKTLDPVVRNEIAARVQSELAQVSPGRGKFFILEHVGDVFAEELEAFGPADIPVYLMRSEDSKTVGKLVDRHVGNKATISDAQKQEIQQTIAGGTVTDEPGRNASFSLNGLSMGVSFVRVWEIATSPNLKGRFFGECALHEFGHQFLGADYHDANKPQRTGIMDPTTLGVANPVRHFTVAERVKMNTETAKLK